MRIKVVNVWKFNQNPFVIPYKNLQIQASKHQASETRLYGQCKLDLIGVGI